MDNLTFRDWSGGLVTDQAEFDLKRNELSALKNLFVEGRGQRLTLRAGQGVKVSGLNSPTGGFTRFRVFGSPHLVYENQGSVVAQNEISGAITTVASFGVFGQRYEFAAFSAYGRDRLYFVSGNDFRVWDGTGPAVDVGLTPPSAVAQPTVSGAGSLVTTNLTPYQYYVTFETADGIESNPNPLPSPGVTTSGSGVFVTVPLSADSRTAKRNLYRIGGRLSRPTYVNSVNDNVTTGYLDTTADVNLGTRYLSFAHNQIPATQGFDLLSVNKGRLIVVDCAKNKVFISSLAAPDYFPEFYEDPVADGRIFVVDPDVTNPIVAIGFTGSATLLCRRKDTYILQGQDGDQFTLNKVCDVGCIARRSLVMCGNIAVWLAPDGTVWALTANGPEHISERVEPTLKATTEANRALACACYWQNRYLLCIPQGTGTPLFLSYDFNVNAWSDLSESFLSASQLYSETGLGDSDEILFATTSGYRDINNAAWNGIGYALRTGTTAPLRARAKTGFLQPYGGGDRGRIDRVRVRGTIVPTPNTSGGRLRLTADGVTRNYALASGSGVLLERRVDAALAGRDIQVEVDAYASQLQIDEVSLYTVKVGRKAQ